MNRSYDEYREIMSLFSVKHKITRTNEKNDFHIHDAFEIFLNLSEEGMGCRIGDGVYRLEKNTLLLFNSMDLHHISIMKPGIINNRYVLYFQPEFISGLSSADTDLLECFYFRPFADPCVLPLTDEKSAGLIPIFEEMIEAGAEVRGHDYGDDLLIKFLLGKLLIKVNLAYREAHSIKADAAGAGKWRMYDIINFVHKNYFDDLSLDVLAQRFHINKYYLCARFKNVTGMSPAQYLINCRILKAKELLLRDYSVEEVCDLAGFNNLPHFSRSFKQHTGHSPKQYQLTMHNDSPGAAGEIGVSGVSEEPSAPSRKTAAGPFTRTAKFNL